MFKEGLRSSLWVLDSTPTPAKIGAAVYSPLHYGDDLEIDLICGIEGEMLIDGRRYRLEEKNVFFMPPRTLHAAVFEKGGGRSGDMIRAFHLNLGRVGKFVDLSRILSEDGRSFRSFAVKNSHFDEIYSSICRIIDEKLPFSKRILSLIGIFELLEEQQEPQSPGLGVDRRVRTLIDWVEGCFGERITVEEAAEKLGYSKYYFCKWFKTQAGVSFHQFLRSVRIDHARTLLLSGCTIGETAERCGFTDPSHFIQSFKKQVGATPRDYILKNGKL